MLTIRDALELPIFEQATLVAGKEGIDRVIRWVHIVSMPESEGYEWTKGGELVLTVGFGLRANEEKQAQVIQSLKNNDIIGMILSIGHYFEETPEILIDEANRLGFPIIEVPGDLLFLDITEAIFTRIVNEQYAVQQRSQIIHQSLTDIVLNGGTLQQLTDALARFLDKAITIESETFRVLASSEQGDIDEARERTLQSGHTTPDIIQYLQQTGLQKQLIKNKQPIKFSPQPDYGVDIERVVAPILVGKNLLGYMWIIADDGKLTELDTLAVEQAATVAALLLYKEKAVQESQRAMRGDFFSQLLQADTYSIAHLESQADIFNFRLNRNYQVIVIQGTDSLSDMSHTVELTLSGGVPALVVMRENRIVVVVQARQEPNGKKIAHKLYQALSRNLGTYIIGVGTSTSKLAGIATSYERSIEAATIAYATKQTSGVFLFDELGLLHWVQHLPDDVLQANIFYRIVRDLDANDSLLCQTLEIFLEFGGSLKDAADHLFIHRNTLTYRLDRIEKVTGLNLRETHNQFNLYIALKTYRLRHDSQSD